MKKITVVALVISFLFSCNSEGKQGIPEVEEKETVVSSQETNTLSYPEEVHLANVQQLTFGGDNAEAYWSFDDSQLVFQRRREEDGVLCDQIFIADVPAAGENFDFKMVSNGKGRTTCSYFLPGNEKVIYASTHGVHEECPPEPDRSMGYVWPLYPEFEIYITDREGNLIEQLTDNNYYDAEATVSPTENKIVYTSDKSGDIELYVLDLDTREEIQVTNELGYDGGAFFSPDGTKLVWRSSRPTSDEDVKHYKDLLANHLVEPSDMELYVANIDGSDVTKVTDLGGANWAPFFHPSGEKIIFCSNHKTGAFPFNLFMVNIDGTGLEQVTFNDTFDSFPMFSFDGKKLIFASNRNNGGTRETNLFMADWMD